jgi:hypothetical protein
MKNIHVLPTDKPSRLFKFANELHLDTIPKDYYKKYNINITSDEEIKKGDKDFYIIANDRDKTWINRIEKVIECKIDPKHGKVLILSSGFIYIDEGCKIILTTDPDLIKDGVEAIDDEFLEWFVKNPSCEEVDVNDWMSTNGTIAFGGDKRYQICNHIHNKIIIPQEEPKQIKCYCGHTTYCDCSPLEEAPNMDKQVLVKMWESAMPKLEPKQETLEEAAEKEFPLIDTEWCRTGACKEENLHLLGHRKSFIKGAKYQAERMYTLEQISKDFIGEEGQSGYFDDWLDYRLLDSKNKLSFREWFEQFKKK